MSTLVLESSALNSPEAEAHEIIPGAYHLPGVLTLDEQQELVYVCRDTIAHPNAKLYQPDGYEHQVSSMGQWWRPPQMGGYLPERIPLNPWVASLGEWVAGQAGLRHNFRTQAAVIHWYPKETTEDHNEHAESPSIIFRGSPLILLMLGNTATFRCRGKMVRSRFKEVQVCSGDAIVLADQARTNFFGFSQVLPGSAPGELVMKPGRLVISVRQVNPLE